MVKNQKNKPVFWSNESKRNLESIYDHIETYFSKGLAQTKVEAIINEIETLSQFPRKGKISEHFNEIRELIVAENTVFYRNNEQSILIASIRPRATKAKLK